MSNEPGPAPFIEPGPQQTIFTITSDGNIVLGEGITPDEASAALWAHFKATAPAQRLERARLLLLRYRSLYHTLTDTIEASDWILPSPLDDELDELYNDAGALLDE